MITYIQTWSIICAECDDPTPDNGNVNGTSRLLDHVLSVSCTKGFTLTGNSVIRCRNDSTWSDYPNCTIVDCGVLQIANMTINLENVTTYGQIADVRCNQDFIPLGSWTVKCEASGVWNHTHVPKCELIDCGNPTPTKGLVNSSETTVNAVVSVSCENGYIMYGDSVITCLRNGTWSGYPKCDPSDCGRPAIANAKIMTNTSTSLNSQAVISCNEGFNLEGPSVITCTETGWSDNVTCSQIDCGKMDVSNGRVIGTYSHYGAVIEVECNTGYFIRGDIKLTCQGTGQWSNNPTCVIQDCNNVTTPTNGIILTSPVFTTYNSSLRFQCESGYQLIGNDILWCDAAGNWNSSVPTCNRKYCGDPTPANGELNGTSFYYTDVVSVSCKTGYSLSGGPVMKCQSNSNWTDYPTCIIVVCEQIDLKNEFESRGMISRPTVNGEMTSCGVLLQECGTALFRPASENLTSEDNVRMHECVGQSMQFVRTQNVLVYLVWKTNGPVNVTSPLGGRRINSLTFLETINIDIITHELIESDPRNDSNSVDLENHQD
ncbi:hypothetical protein DPMN_181750 [Dreissena polymorpha]|uniref:Sushi domain-containing protein n=1 Tax=Dreissena polymorpha TaxID=45954 RepID=A0A9D4I3Z6_DREPO|nr:hypothetical protein DPMN_181750 [Dreissena polymorpha]